MKVITVTILANVVGLATAALALALLAQTNRGWRTGFRSRRELGLLSLFVAGCLLAAGGQYTLSRRLHEPASQAVTLAKMQVALREPLEALAVQIQGPDPFRAQPDSCSLRLIAISRAGQRLISEVPQSQLSLNVEAQAPGAIGGESREYRLAWHSIIEGARDEKSRAMAARIGSLNDWRRFDRVEVEIIARTEVSIPMPDSLRIATIADPPVELLNGRNTSEKAERRGDGWVGVYEDPVGLSPADRITGWKAEETYRNTEGGLGLISAAFLAAGGSLLAVGIGLLARGHGPSVEADREVRVAGSPHPTRLITPSVEAGMLESDGPTEPGHNMVPSRGRAWTASAFVWGIWVLMLLAALAYVGRYGSNFPLADDWMMIPYLTGEEPITFTWLWSPYNEHRIPLPKLVWIALFRLGAGDFRAAMYFNVLALGALAFALILGARGLRGWTSYADAFFPLVLLNWGQWVSILWLATAQYVLTTILACTLLLIIIRCGRRVTLGAAVLAGICLAMLPLSGAAGLLLVPALALWLGYVGLVLRPFQGPSEKRDSLLIFGLLSAALLVVLVCLSSGIERTAWARTASISLWDLWRVAIQFLALSLGPASRSFWPYSGLGMLGLLLLTAVLLVVIWIYRPLERRRALGLLLFLGSMASLALGLAWGRAGLVPPGAFLGLHYVTLAVPVLCCVYYTAILYSSWTGGRLAQVSLFTLLLPVVPLNTSEGIHGGSDRRKGMEAIEKDLKSGVPPYMLIARHRDSFSLGGLVADSEIAGFIQQMRRYGVYSFVSMCENPAFRVIPLPAVPSAVNRVELEPGECKGYGTGPESYLTFSLPEPMLIAGVRIRGQIRGKHPYPMRHFRLYLRERGQADIPNSPQIDVNPWVIRKQDITTFYISTEIDQIRIHPGETPCTFDVSEIELLVPLSDDRNPNLTALAAGIMMRAS